MHSLRATFVLLIALAASLAQFGCKGSSGSAQSGGRPAMKFPVETQVVQSRDSYRVIRAVGSVEAFEIVPVTARVSGVVHKVAFKEGDYTKAGQGLIEIEPERYELNVQTALANFDKAKANLLEVNAGLERRIDIEGKNPGFVSDEEMQNWKTRALSARADSARTAAEYELAKLNARDAHVPAPVSGLIQSRQVSTGQYIQLGTVIATMIRKDPLQLKFSVPVHEAEPLTVGAEVEFLARETVTPQKAKVTAITESADPQTRMVQVVAEVIAPYPESLRPGVFAEVTARLGEASQLPVVPQTAIRPSEKGFLAYVVKDSTVEERVITLGLQTEEGTVEIKSGVNAGETLVIRGSEALTNGALVRVSNGAAKQ